jgi:hypothetical protein
MGSISRRTRPLRRDPPLSALESDGRGPAAAAPAPVEEKRSAPERAIVCASCGHAITSERERIRILEAHEHRFMNPAGSLFHIGCFARADGCLAVGPPSDDYPWFPGFAWQVALCGACAEHLGWHFRSASDSFFGLRLERLRAAGAT